MILNTFCIWFERLGFGAPSLHIPSRVCRFLKAQQSSPITHLLKLSFTATFSPPILRTATCRHFLLRKTCRKFSRIRANIKRQARQARTEEDVSSKLRSTVTDSIWKWNAWTFFVTQSKHWVEAPNILYLKKRRVSLSKATYPLCHFDWCSSFFQLKENLWPFWMTRRAPTAQSLLSNLYTDRVASSWYWTDHS